MRRRVAEHCRAGGKKVAAGVEIPLSRQAKRKVRDGIAETLSYYSFPETHWRRVRTNNPLERLLREVRRRTRVVGAFPDGEAALMLTAAGLRHVAGTDWGRSATCAWRRSTSN